MKATWSTTCDQDSSLLSRTPNDAEIVRPLPQMPSKPASSTMRAERPLCASIRKAISGRVISRLSTVVGRSLGLSILQTCAESIANLRRAIRDAWDIRLLGGRLHEDEMRAVGGEGGAHRGLHIGGRRHRAYRRIAGGGGHAIQADAARGRDLIARRAVDLVVEDHVDEAARRQSADHRENAEVHQQIA